MRLEISGHAERDLEELHLYGISRYGLRAADAYLGELFAKLGHIAQHPLAAQERFGTRPPVRLVVQRAHNILYTVADETVTILRVLHHSANWIEQL